MGLIFSSDFAGGASGWTQNGGADFLTIGCSGTRCLTCASPNNLMLGQYFAPASYTAGTARMQFAYRAIAPSDPLTSVAYLLSSIGPEAFGEFMFSLLVNPDGSIQLDTDGNLNERSTAPGVIPTDGTFHAIQIAWTLYVTGAVHAKNVRGDFTIVKDNVVVATWTNAFMATFDHGPGPKPASWNQVWLAAWEDGFSTPHYANWAIDNFEVDDTVSILSRLPCTSQPLSATSCVTGITPVITGLAIDCDTGRLTITGSPFSMFAFVSDLEGPNGPVDFEVVSQDFTTIVLQLTDPFVDGYYCATVQNTQPTSPESIAFCATLSCNTPTGLPGCPINFPAGFVPPI